MRRFGILLATALLVAGCVADTPAETENTASALSTPTLPPTTTSTPTTTTAPEQASPWGQPDWWHSADYQSPGYSCGPDPTKHCAGNTTMRLDRVWIGYDDNGDWIDLIADSNLDDFYYGWVGDIPAETGLGVRFVQLDSPPDDVPVPGEAWVEVTISSFSATGFSTRPPEPADPTKKLPRYKAPTGANPTTLTPPPGATQLIEAVVLVASTNDMSQWIIGFKHPGTYSFVAGYFAFASADLLQLRFLRVAA